MQQTGLKRNAQLDKFYTKVETAKECIIDTNKLFPLDTFNVIIEPAAGSGAFSNEIKNHTVNHVIALDIAPEHESIKQQDYLTLSDELIEDLKTKNVLVISNVPFGRQSSLAKKFIKQSARFANVMSFILPNSFKKDSMKKSFPLEWHCVFEKDLPIASFQVNLKDYSVPCVFQIWTKKTEHRVHPKKIETCGFKFVKVNEDHDMIFRRVGVNAGVVSEYKKNVKKSVQSHYFITLEKLNKDFCLDIISKLNAYTWTFDNHVGPKSIAKTELVPVLNSIIQTSRFTT